jgi:hypothetical protein
MVLRSQQRTTLCCKNRESSAEVFVGKPLPWPDGLLSKDKECMPGLYYDQFHVGQVFKHPIRRTITEADNVWLSAVTHNLSYLHLDEEYCRSETEFGQRHVRSAPDYRHFQTQSALRIRARSGHRVSQKAVSNRIDVRWPPIRSDRVCNS